MRLLLLSALLVYSCTATMAQELVWTTSLDSAKVAAVENDAAILLVFAGSDWCRPCIQLKENILSQPAFAAATADELVILYADFPARKKNQLSDAQTKQNEALAERYNKLGAFPKLVLLNSDEELLAEPEYKGQSVEAFVDLLTKRD